FGTVRNRFVRQVMMLGRMVVPHRSMRRHELDPSSIVNLGFGGILRTITPKQNTQVIPVHGIHARSEDKTKAAIIGLRVSQTRTATHPAHSPLDYAPRRWVCLPAIKTLTVENLHATRVRNGLAVGCCWCVGFGWSLVSSGTAKEHGTT